MGYTTLPGDSYILDPIKGSGNFAAAYLVYDDEDKFLWNFFAFFFFEKETKIQLR